MGAVPEWLKIKTISSKDDRYYTYLTFLNQTIIWWPIYKNGLIQYIW